MEHCLFSEYFLQHRLPNGQRAFRCFLVQCNSSTSCRPFGIKSFQHRSPSKSAPEVFLSHSTVSLNSGMGQAVSICFSGPHTGHHFHPLMPAAIYVLYIPPCILLKDVFVSALFKLHFFTQSPSYCIFLTNSTPCPCRPV